MPDRRGENRTEPDGIDLTVAILSGDNTIRGQLQNVSPGGIQVEIPGTMFAPVLSRRRVIAVEVRSCGQPVFHASLIVVYITEKGDGSGLLVGLRFIRTEAVAEEPAPPPAVEGEDRPERRRCPRSSCEIPAVLTVGGGDMEQSLPIIVTSVSEIGCRVEGPSDLDYLLQGTMVQLTIEPWDIGPILLLAEVVSVHTARALGVRFRQPAGSEEGVALDRLVTSLRYPDLVVEGEPDAEGIWATLSASGYFRERAPETYHRLHTAAVDCWERLNSAAARSVNRTMTTPGPDGGIASVCQLSRFYVYTWMAHHLAVLGDLGDRTRLAPQQFGGVFDTLHQMDARYFINYHNASHKAQNHIWIQFAERHPETEISLRPLACFDVVTEGEAALRTSPDVLRVRQVGDESVDRLLPLLRAAYPPLVFDAMGFEDDLLLERLNRDYGRVGLERRRCWILSEAPDGTVLGLASLEVVPTGFNLTSIGDHVLLHVLAPPSRSLEAAAAIHQLIHHATLYFGRLDKPHFLVMADLQWEGLLQRSLGSPAMAHAHELILPRRLFYPARDFIRTLYEQRNTP